MVYSRTLNLMANINRVVFTWHASRDGGHHTPPQSHDLILADDAGEYCDHAGLDSAAVIQKQIVL